MEEQERRRMSYEELVFNVFDIKRRLDEIEAIVIGKAPEFSGSIALRLNRLESELDRVDESLDEVGAMLKKIYSQVYINTISVGVTLIALVVSLFLGFFFN